jgi:hypothetical protein
MSVGIIPHLTKNVSQNYDTAADDAIRRYYRLRLPIIIFMYAYERARAQPRRLNRL